jgi:1-acyl-sn-glycerol-3-phosphate acyltransferase
MIVSAAGWQVQIQPPPRCVIIGAPHTSNWDLPLTLLMMLSGNLKLCWVGKDTLFRGPLGWLLRAGRHPGQPPLAPALCRSDDRGLSCE